MERVKSVLAAMLVLGPSMAPAFELSLHEPELNLTVPGVPAVELHEATGQSGPPKRTLAGSGSSFSIEVDLLPQSHQVSPSICAGGILRSLVIQPGMPNRDNIYRAPLNETTFLVIYVLGEGQEQSLHAHVISAAGTSHCANAHFTRQASPGEDIDNWRTTFTSARVGTPAR